MKGVCALGMHLDASAPEGGRSDAAPLLASGIFPTRNADGAALSLLPSL